MGKEPLHRRPSTYIQGSRTRRQDDKSWEGKDTNQRLSGPGVAGRGGKGLEISNNYSEVSVDAYPMPIPTHIQIIVLSIIPYQQPTAQPNYFAVLSMEEDDDDDITVVTSIVAQSRKLDDATVSTACISEDDMSYDEELPNSLPY